MKWIRAVLSMALLFQTGYVPCSAVEAWILSGDEITPDQLTVGEFVEIVFRDQNGRKKKQEAILKLLTMIALP